MTKKEGTLFRQDTAGSYRSDCLGDTRGVACFTSSDGDVLFPENGTGSGGQLTNGPHPASVLRCWEPLPSRSSRGKRKGIRWWGEYAFSVVCRLQRALDGDSIFFAGWSPELDDTTRNGRYRYRFPVCNSHMVFKCGTPPRIVSNYSSFRTVNINIVHASLSIYSLRITTRVIN